MRRPLQTKNGIGRSDRTLIRLHENIFTTDILEYFCTIKLNSIKYSFLCSILCDLFTHDECILYFF